jgi:tape measure domain-containing protein
MSLETVILELIVSGAAKANAALGTVTASTTRLRNATTASGVAMERTAKRGFLMNQMLFTMRRLLYMTTLAFIAGGIEAIHWGFQFNNTMQQGRQVLARFMGSTAAANKELDYLFNLAAYSPFQFQDLTKAAARMYAFGFQTNQVNRIMVDLTDALTGTLNATPAAMNRVSVALGHMMSMGTATGQILNQLARDGIPGVYKSIEKYFGLSAQQAHHIGALGIPSSEILKAIEQGIETSKLHGIARKMQESTLHGVWTTFRDFTSQIMGDIEMRPFNFLQRMFNRVNPVLQRMQKGFKTGGFKGMWEGMSQGHPNAFENDLRQVALLLQKVWAILTKAVIPAFQFWGKILSPFGGTLTMINSVLGFFAKHMWLTKILMMAIVYQLTLWQINQFRLFVIMKSQALWTFIKSLFALNLALLRGLILTTIFVIRLALFMALLIAYATVVAVVTIAQWAWNAALVAFEFLEIATGIFLIVAAVSALVYGMHELITHWHEVVRWIKSNWIGIGAVLGGPFLAMAFVAFFVFEKLKRYVGAAFDWIKRKVEAIWGWVKRIINPFGIFGSGHHGGGGTIPSFAASSNVTGTIPTQGTPTFKGGLPTNALNQNLTIKVPVNIDGKKVAEAVAEHKNDVRANQ